MKKVKTYSNGLRLVVDEMPSFESVAFNIYVQTGSINETPKTAGISHYIEHMLFTGTKTRTSFDIVSELSAIGADVNAFTDKTETVYHTKSISDKTEKCVEILSDMLFNTTFGDKQMKKEKKVVCEELSMYNDNPEFMCQSEADRMFYEGTPFADDVGGKKSTVRAITRDDIRQYMQKYYVANNIIISFAGKIEFEYAQKLVEKYFIPYFSKEKSAPRYIEASEKYHKTDKIKCKKQFKDNEQAQVCIMFPNVTVNDELKSAVAVFNQLWGVGMNSRLFQAIREKLGLVYSIYSQATFCKIGGDLCICFGTTVKNVSLALATIKKEIDLLLKNGIEQKEFESAKFSVISKLRMSYEVTISKSLANARELALFGKVFDDAEKVEKYQRVSIDDVNKVSKIIYQNNNYAISLVSKDTQIDVLKFFK